jgi:putative ABC transport system permease protein
VSPRRKFFRLPWRTKRQIRADLETELSFHLDMRVDALIALGLSPDAARAQAMREFGDIDDARRYIGAVDFDTETAQRRSEYMRDLWQDITYAARKLRATPAFTVAAIVTLALGIGATTAIFSVVDRVLLQPPPFANPDHLVRIRFSQQGHGDAGTPMDIVDYPSQAKDFVGFSVMDGWTANVVRETGDAERVPGVRVGANFFDLLRVKPLLGRFFREGEDRAGAPDVVVLSEQLWRRVFGANEGVIGKTVRISSRPFTIIGVAPAGERYPFTVELWAPRSFTAQELSDESRGARWLAVMARVKDGVSVEAANNEVRLISESMEHRFPEPYRERRARVMSIQEFTVGDLRKPLYVILAAVVLVLLIACANVTNLLLVRASSRETEMAIRSALGAGRGRLVRQLMTESVMLAAVGAAVGIGLAKLGMTVLLGHVPPGLVLVNEASIDGRTLALTTVVAVLSGLIFGSLPALQVAGSGVATTLRAGGRGAHGKSTASRAKRAIVVAELALAVTLLSGAGLLLRSFNRLMSVDPGFRPEAVLSMKVSLPQSSYDSTSERNFVRQVMERASALPGVTSAAIGNFVPLDGATYDFTFTIRGRPALRPSDEPDAQIRQVTPNYFVALGEPVLRGRAIQASDVPGAPSVYVVNQAFVKRHFPNESPIGQFIKLGWGGDPNEPYGEIVGVVGDVRGSGLADEPIPTVYASLAQYPFSNLTILVRTNAPPASLTAPLRAIVRDLDHEVPVFSVQTMQERVASSVGRERFYTTLVAIFAAVALVLAAVGLYGVIAYAVSQRTHELGVRVALGATSQRISAMVIREGLALTAVGAGLGIVAALGAGSVVASLLFGVTPRDPITLGGVVVVLAAVAMLASWLPARRAARVDPLVAMRGE